MSLPPFSMVPTIAWGDCRLLESDLRVLGALCSFWNRDEGAAWPSHRKIAERAGVSRRTVISALARLRAAGFVEWDERWTSTGNRQPNAYYIVDLPGSEIQSETSEAQTSQGSEAQGSQDREELASPSSEAQDDTTLRSAGFTQTDQPSDQDSDQESDQRTAPKRAFADERTAREKQAFYLEQIAREEAKAAAGAS
jgi:DNA-binding transcriptional MocR family regulator